MEVRNIPVILKTKMMMRKVNKMMVIEMMMSLHSMRVHSSMKFWDNIKSS